MKHRKEYDATKPRDPDWRLTCIFIDRRKTLPTPGHHRARDPGVREPESRGQGIRAPSAGS